MVEGLGFKPGVTECARHTLPPVRVLVAQVQALNEREVQPVVGNKQRAVEQKKTEYAVVFALIAACARGEAAHRQIFVRLRRHQETSFLSWCFGVLQCV